MLNKSILFVVALTTLVSVSPTFAGPVVWNKGGTGGDNTYNLTDAANWSGGYPANGSNVFIVLSAATGNNWTQTITNAPADKFYADSLSVSNTSSKGHLVVTFNGQAFLTNGVGRLDIGGVTQDRNLTVTFSSNLQAKAIQFTGSAGSGTASLSLNGPTSVGSLTFNASAGNNALRIRGSLNVADALIVTNLGSNCAGTLSANATVSRLLLNNPSNARFTITNSTTTLNGAAESVAGGFTLANDATLSVIGSGGLVFSNVAPAINGTVHITSSKLESKTTWSNNGTVILDNGLLTGAGTVTNLAAREIRGSGTISSRLINNGSLVASDGELRLEYSAIGAGGYRAASGGTLSFVNGGSISALANNGGTVRVQGVLTNTTGFTNQGTLSLAGGTYYSPMLLSNPAGMTISGFGTITAPLNNNGTVKVGAPALTFGAVVTNAGWINFDNGAGGTFSESLFHSGTLALGNGAAHFQKNLFVATNGVLTARAGAKLYLRGDFLNYSTANTAFDLLEATVKFDGGSTTQLFRIAGLNLGPYESGFTNNFAIGELWIGGSTGVVKLIGDSPVTNALYVDSLTVTPGSMLMLNGFTVYAWVADVQGLINTDFGGQLVIIPEPSSLTAAACGVLLLRLLLRRRRG